MDEGSDNRILEKTVMKSLIIALPAKYNNQMEDDMSKECSTHVRKEKCIQSSNKEMLRKEMCH